jgi:antitoxin VapB
MYQTAKIFTNGQSQAVRLPKAFRFNTKEVFIQQLGDNIILSAKKPTWQTFFQQNSVFDDDFLAERNNDAPQEREPF